MRLLALLAVSGCTWVSDAQYEDRVEELEEAREEFVPAADKVRFLTTAGNKLYYVYEKNPLDTLTVVVFDTVTNSKLELAMDPPETNVDDFVNRYAFSDQLVVGCDGSTTRAWSSATGAELPAPGESVSTFCGATGGDVYYVVGSTPRELKKWTPGSTPVTHFDLTPFMVGSDSLNGLAVYGTKGVLAEGDRSYVIDLAGKRADWLMNEDFPFQGLVVMDEQGTVFDSTQGVHYMRFDDLVAQPVSQLIANGGYRLNSKHTEIHDLADSGNYMLHKRYIVYRGNSGTFAYHLDTGKVTDLLLDRTDRSAVYRGACITDNGQLFVQHRTTEGFSSEDQPVYRVDVSARLP